MKTLTGTGLCLMLFLIGSAMADMPELQPGVFLQNGATELKVNLMANPFVVDWNNDGAKDLLVGQFVYGNIALFLNKGSDFQPEFQGMKLLTSNASAITTTYG